MKHLGAFLLILALFVPALAAQDILQTGSVEGTVVDKDKFNIILEEYYADRNFNPQSGLPTRAGLERLGLEYIADDLETRSKLG